MSVYEKVYPFLTGLTGDCLTDTQVSSSPFAGSDWTYIISYNSTGRQYNVDELIGLSVKSLSDTSTWLNGQITANSNTEYDLAGNAYIGVHTSGTLIKGDQISINYYYDPIKADIKDSSIIRKDSNNDWSFFFPIDEYRPESFSRWIGLYRELSENSTLEVYFKLARIQTMYYPPPRPPSVYLEVVVYNDSTGLWETADLFVFGPINTIQEVDDNIHKLYEQDSNFRGIIPIIYFPTAEGTIGLDSLSVLNEGYRPVYDKHKVFGYLRDANGQPIEGEVIFTPLFNNIKNFGLIERDKEVIATIDSSGYFEKQLVTGAYKIAFPRPYSEVALVDIEKDTDISDIL